MKNICNCELIIMILLIHENEKEKMKYKKGRTDYKSAKMNEKKGVNYCTRL